MKPTSPEQTKDTRLSLLALMGLATGVYLLPVSASAAISDVSTEEVGVSGDVIGVAGDDYTLDAQGGTDVLTPDEDLSEFVDASASAIGIDGGVLADGPGSPGVLSGSHDLTATGGSATTTGVDFATSDADALILGSGYVEGDFSGSIDGSATGGTATANASSETDAVADATALGISGLSGDATGSIDVSAEGGTANSGQISFPDYASSYAGAEASAIGKLSKRRIGIPKDGIEAAEVESEPRLIEGEYSATATGGEADAEGFNSAEAYADASAQGIYLGELFEGEVDATVSALAEGGSAEADSFNYADSSAAASAEGLNGVAFFESDLSGSVSAEATGGTADSNSEGGAFADAGAFAVGLNFLQSDIFDMDGIEGIARPYIFESVFFGDLVADISVSATGGSAYAQGVSSGDFLDAIEEQSLFIGGTYAFAGAYAAGIDNLLILDGDSSGSLEVSAIGGEATALSFGSSLSENDAIEAIDPSSGIAVADASGIAKGIAASDYEELNDSINDDSIEGLDLSGSLTIFGEVSSDITVDAQGGTAEAVLFGDIDSVGVATAEAYAVATGIDGDVGEGRIPSIDGDPLEGSTTALSGSFTLSALGGQATAASEFFYRLAQPEEDSTGIEANGFLGNDLLADASGDAFAVDGDVYGDVSASFDVLAEGGLAYLTGPVFNPVIVEALAYADSAGIYGDLDGDFSGEMNITANGGTAILEGSYGRFPVATDGIETDGFYYEAFADASAIASGIGDGELAILGDVSGDISVEANGGTVGVLADFDGPIGQPIGQPQGDMYFEDAPGLFLPESTFNAYAQAIAIDGSVVSDEISSELSAVANGGSVVLTGLLSASDTIEGDIYFTAFPEAQADALAAGIAGQTVSVGEMSGSITAIATPGVIGVSEILTPLPGDGLEGDEVVESEIPEIPEIDYGVAGEAFAFGIIAYDPVEIIEDSISSDIEAGPIVESSVDITVSGSVHAFTLMPENVPSIEFGEIEEGEPVETGGYAAAIYGGSSDDYVELAGGADILGDINLNGGEGNVLVVTGDTVMLGDILSSSELLVEERLGVYNGSGLVDFDIDSGLFTAVGTVNVSDLLNSIEIAASGGLAPLISRDDSLASVLNVSGEEADINFAGGSTVRPTFNGAEDWTAIGADEQFLIASSSGLIDADGAIVDDSLSPYELTLLKEGAELAPPDAIEGIPAPVPGEDLFIVLGDVKTPGGAQTPGTSQTTHAVNSSSQAVMIDISKRASLLRGLLRGTVASSFEAPVGAAGPDAERMQNGEWLSYVSAFGNIGSQQSDAGAVGFDYDTYGFLFGQEKLVGDQLILGVAGAYSQTDVNGDQGSGGGDTDLYSGVFYGNWFTDAWYVEGGLTYGHAETDTRRVDIANVLYSGDYASDLFGTWFEVGHTTTYEGLEAEPYARASYVYGEHAGFTDSGAGLNSLTTQDTETNNFKTELGLRLTKEWLCEDDNKFFLGVKAAWSHEWADRNVRLDAQYLGAKLNIQSPAADRAALILGVRGEWRNDDGLAIGLKYEPSFAGNWYNHAFSGTIQYNW